MKMSEASIWAEHGGLIGLIIFSLFGLIATFVVVLTRKDKSSQNFIREILSDDREERKEDRSEHRETFNKLSDAINDLTGELRKKD
jgi:predicted LPLAT superfamily acyltransferase